MIDDKVMSILLNTVPPHRGFEFQPVDYGTYVGIRVFLDNFATFSDPQREDLAAWIGIHIINKIRQLGIPCYLEAWETRGGNQL